MKSSASKPTRLKVVSEKDEAHEGCIEVARRLLELAKTRQIYSILAVCDQPGGTYREIISGNLNDIDRLGKLRMLEHSLIDKLHGS